uniref:N-acetylmuramoyl-L-alanine amidase n=1 Tax=Pseudomonas phage HRDY3 TaxID=3236930 RepID=A0AB39CE47_9VIRU
MATNISQRFVKTGDFYLLVDTDLRGGFRIVSSIAERDAIPIQARKQGMMVRVIETTGITNWELGFGKPITNAGWVEASLGGKGDYIPIAGGPLEGEMKLNEFGSVNFNDVLKAEILDGNVQMTRITPQDPDDPEPRGMLTFNNGVENTIELNVEIGQMVCKTEVALASDRTLKTDVRRIVDAVKKARRMHGYTFRKEGQVRMFTGLIAQEVNQIMPEAVVKMSDGKLAVFYGSLMGLMIECIAELDDRLKLLEPPKVEAQDGL